MISKIIGSYVLFACLLSIALYLWGVRAPVHLSTYFQSFLSATNKDLANFRIEIPFIPTINKEIVEYTFDYYNVIDILKNIVLVMTTFINFVVNILNFVIILINTIISVLEFIFLFIRNLIIFKESIPKVA